MLSAITGLCPATIRRGRAELAGLLEGTPLERAQGRPGRPSTEEKYPEIKSVLEQLLEDETAGNPMTRKKWVRVSSRNISKKLAKMGYCVNYHTVCRLLKDLGYSMKVNVKKRASTAHSPKRDAQFRYIASQKAAFLAAGNPVISVDAKKKEQVGNFKADGSSWCKDAIEVSDYSFPSMAECIATAFGIYDVRTNKGYVRTDSTSCRFSRQRIVQILSCRNDSASCRLVAEVEAVRGLWSPGCWPCRIAGVRNPAPRPTRETPGICQ